MPNPLIPDDWEFAPTDEYPQRWVMVIAATKVFATIAEMIHQPHGIKFDDGVDYIRDRDGDPVTYAVFLMTMSGEGIEERRILAGATNPDMCRAAARMAETTLSAITSTCRLPELIVKDKRVEME